MTQPIMTEFFKDCSRITEEYEKLCGRWHQDSQLMHVVSEVAEVKDVLRNKKSMYGAPNSDEYRATLCEEIADVFLTSFALVNFLRIRENELNNALVDKLLKVEQRVKEIKSSDKTIIVDMDTRDIIKYDHAYFHGYPEEHMLSIYNGGIGDKHRTIYLIIERDVVHETQKPIIRVRKFL